MRQNTVMTVSLTLETRVVVPVRLARGRFQGADELVRAALRLPERREHGTEAREAHRRGR